MKPEDCELKWSKKKKKPSLVKISLFHSNIIIWYVMNCESLFRKPLRSCNICLNFFTFPESYTLQSFETSISKYFRNRINSWMLFSSSFLIKKNKIIPLYFWEKGWSLKQLEPSISSISLRTFSLQNPIKQFPKNLIQSLNTPHSLFYIEHFLLTKTLLHQYHY